MSTPTPPASTPRSVLHMVIGTICAIALLCVGSFAYMAIGGMKPDEAVLNCLKDATTFILGALAGVLVNTRQNAAVIEPAAPEKPEAPKSTQ